MQASNSLAGWLGNLHKGSETGGPWKRIIDAASILLILISLTGLILWISLAKRRTLAIVSLAACVVIVAAVFLFWTP